LNNNDENLKQDSNEIMVFDSRKNSNNKIFFTIKELNKEHQNKIIAKGVIESLVSPAFKK
jgi:hypothetical protein